MSGIMRNGEGCQSERHDRKVDKKPVMWLSMDASFSAGQLGVSLSEDCKELGLEEQEVGRKLIAHDKKQ